MVAGSGIAWAWMTRSLPPDEAVGRRIADLADLEELTAHEEGSALSQTGGTAGDRSAAQIVDEEEVSSLSRSVSEGDIQVAGEGDGTADQQLIISAPGR